jgi:hypothetical protein
MKDSKETARKHNDMTREKFPRFQVLSYQEGCRPSIAYDVLATVVSNKQTVIKHSLGSGEGKLEDSLVIIGANPKEVSRIATEYFKQICILDVLPNREAYLVFADGHREYAGHWESVGKLPPSDDENFTVYNGEYFVCRKYEEE